MAYVRAGCLWVPKTSTVFKLVSPATISDFASSDDIRFRIEWMRSERKRYEGGWRVLFFQEAIFDSLDSRRRKQVKGRNGASFLVRIIGRRKR